MYKKLVLAAAIAAMSVGAQAQITTTTVINFEDAPTALGSVVGGITASENTLATTGGKTFSDFVWQTDKNRVRVWDPTVSATTLNSGTLGTAFGSYTGSGVSGGWLAVMNTSKTTLTFSQASGQAFSLDSIFLYAGKAKDAITITGYLNSGSVGSMTIGGASAAAGAVYDLNGLNSTFSSVDRISIYTAQGALGIDNITVSPVPEPGTYAMLLAGLGLVGAMARRRRQA